MWKGIENFLDFCKNKVSFIAIGIIVVMSYGLRFTQITVGIDEEGTAVYLGGRLIQQNRIMHNVMDKIFHSYEFLPLWVAVYSIIVYIVGLLIWLYGLNKHFTFFSKGVVTVCIGVMVSFPYIAKAAIFNYTIMGMGYCICLTAFALSAAYKLLCNKSVKYYLVILFCLCGVFMFERAYIILFCQGIATFALIEKARTETLKFSEIVKWGIKLIITLVMAYILSRGIILSVQTITGLKSDGYTSNYIRYDLSGIEGFISSARNFFRDYRKVIFNRIEKNVYAEQVYLFFVIIMIGLSIYNSIIKKSFSILLIGLVNVVLPVSCYLASGNVYLPLRAVCLNYAFFVGSAILYAAYTLKICERETPKREVASMLFYIICFLIIGNQSREMEEVYYQKYISFEKDRRTAEMILNKIEEECGKMAVYRKPIVFLGFLNSDDIAYTENVEEASMFNWDRNSSVIDEEQSSRIYDFYDVLGYSICQPDNIDYREARKIIANMQSFPQDGCVNETENYIVVKLGDSLCEILDVDAKDVIGSQFWGNIELFSYNESRISMKGWLVKKGTNSYDANLSLVLKSRENKYKLRIDEESSEDITEYISDGINYDNCRYNFSYSLPEYIASGEYQVYIELDNNGYSELYDVNQIIMVEQAVLPLAKRIEQDFE